MPRSSRICRVARNRLWPCSVSIAKATTVGDPSYRTIKGILVAGVETDPPRPSAGDAGAAAHLHGPSQLFANVIPLPTTDPASTAPTATTNGEDEPEAVAQ